MKFYPIADDIDDFISDVNKTERAQVMAIRHCMPIEVFTICLRIDHLDDLRTALIKVFGNPKVKSNYASASGATAVPTAFFMARCQEEDRPSTVTSDDVGEFMSKFDSLEYSIRKMSVADPRHRQQKFEPEVTSSHQRGGQSRGEVVDSTANIIICPSQIVNNTTNRIIDPAQIVQGTPISIEIIIEIEEGEDLIKVRV